MFHPVGRQRAAVYWRRRLMFVAAVIALVALIAVTAHVALSKGSGGPVAGGSSGHTTPAQTTPAPNTSIPASSTPPVSSQDSSSAGSTGASSGPGSSSVVPQPCSATELSVAATTSAPSYAVGAEPTLSLQVTNVGAAPCVQNLADSQVVLRVYNGVSRVWGSHDCEIQPGTDDRTLGVNMPVKISIVWSGQSSQPNCAGTRQQVGAGTYTLYATLSGHSGKAAQFAIH